MAQPVKALMYQAYLYESDLRDRLCVEGENQPHKTVLHTMTHLFPPHTYQTHD